MLFRRRLEHKFKAQQLHIFTRTHISIDSSLCCERKQICFCKTVTFLKLSKTEKNENFYLLTGTFVKRAPCFIHCEGKAAKGRGVLMSIMSIRSTHVNHDPNLQRSRIYEILEEKFCAVRKRCDRKNIIPINKYNVEMTSLDRAIIVSDTLRTETSPIFIS